MSGGEGRVPLVIRTQGGAGNSLAAQHSQSLEALFYHVPGLKVVMPATPADAKGLLKAAIRDDNPVVFIEGEMLYNLKGEVPDEEYIIPIGKADIKRAGNDVTIICHSKTVAPALNAAKTLSEEGIDAEVLDLRTIRPLDIEAILASVAKTNRVVVAEEGWEFAGVGAQVVDVIQREAFDDLDGPIHRLTTIDSPAIYSPPVENEQLPNPSRVLNAALEALR
jgi:pyruvate dehydrogenase E1 component beta subunit